MRKITVVLSVLLAAILAACSQPPAPAAPVEVTRVVTATPSPTVAPTQTARVEIITREVTQVVTASPSPVPSKTATPTITAKPLPVTVNPAYVSPAPAVVRGVNPGPDWTGNIGIGECTHKDGKTTYALYAYAGSAPSDALFKISVFVSGQAIDDVTPAMGDFAVSVHTAPYGDKSPQDAFAQVTSLATGETHVSPKIQLLAKLCPGETAPAGMPEHNNGPTPRTQPTHTP
jgi:hypothetical protein